MTATRTEIELKHIPRENDVYYPENIKELKELILFAKKNHFIVRAIGSGHSPISSIYGKNEKEIKLCLDGDFRKINTFIIDKEKNTGVVCVGAGCYLGLNPHDKKSTWENSFNKQIHEKGFALPITGTISHQSIAGCLQTSTSGGSTQHGIADVIEEIEWMNGLGELCRAKRGEENFNAVGVSMGLLGIITHVTFKLPQTFSVSGIEANAEIKNSFLAKDEKGNFSKLDKAFFEEKEYMRLSWFPQKYTQRVNEWTGKSVPVDSKKIPYHHPLESKKVSISAAAALILANQLATLGTDLAERLLGLLIKPFVKIGQTEYCDVWYKTLPNGDQAHLDNLMSLSYSELWFPRESLNIVMKTIEELVAKNPKAAGNFVIELYCAKQSPFMLSPSEGHDAFRVDLCWYDHNRRGNANEYFGFFWEKLLSLPGARLHWGKYLPHIGEKYGEFEFKPEILQRNYPKLANWLKIREKMDPDQLFVTNYWREYLGISKLKKMYSKMIFFPLKDPIETQEKTPQPKMITL